MKGKLTLLRSLRQLLLCIPLLWGTHAALALETSLPAPIPAEYYRDLGIPAIDKPWTPSDYLQTSSLLGPVAQQNPQYLPHYSDKTAAPYMTHMADGRNMYEVLRFSASHDQRLELIMLYLDALQRLQTLYHQALSPEIPYYAEWLDLIALSSYLAALSAPEWQYYFAQGTDPQDTNAEAKREAVLIIQTALVNPVIVGVQALPTLPAQLAWRLVKNLNYSMPTYAASLPLEAQQQLYQALQTAFQQTTDKQIRQGIYQLASQFNMPATPQ